MKNTPGFLIISGSIFMALAVAFGAFGAHAVEEVLTPNRFDVYKTAVQYHFYHALGLLIVGTLSFHIKENKWMRWSGYMLIAGIFLFSGSLYLLTLLDIAWLGAVTPFGGVFFLGGWLSLFIGMAKH